MTSHELVEAFHEFFQRSANQLFYLYQLLADLLVCGALLVVDLDEFPAHDSLRIDYVS